MPRPPSKFGHDLAQLAAHAQEVLRRWEAGESQKTIAQDLQLHYPYSVGRFVAQVRPELARQQGRPGLGVRRYNKPRAQELAEIRQALGLTQKAMAPKLGLKYATTLAHYEQGSWDCPEPVLLLARRLRQEQHRQGAQEH